MYIYICIFFILLIKGGSGWFSKYASCLHHSFDVHTQVQLLLKAQIKMNKNVAERLEHALLFHVSPVYIKFTDSAEVMQPIWLHSLINDSHFLKATTFTAMISREPAGGTWSLSNYTRKKAVAFRNTKVRLNFNQKLLKNVALQLLKKKRGEAQFGFHIQGWQVAHYKR